MTKRFNYHHDGFGAYYLCDKAKGTYEDSIIGEIWADKSDMTDLVDLLNKLSDENEELKIALKDKENLISICEKKFKELGYLITCDDNGYVIE